MSTQQGHLKSVAPGENFVAWWLRHTVVWLAPQLVVLTFTPFMARLLLSIFVTVVMLAVLIYDTIQRWRFDGAGGSTAILLIAFVMIGALGTGILASAPTVNYLRATLMEAIFGNFRHSFSGGMIETVKLVAAVLVVGTIADVAIGSLRWTLYPLEHKRELMLARRRATVASTVLQQLKAGESTSPFALYLRPFTSTGVLAGAPITTADEDFESSHIDLETIFFQALHHKYDLIASGRDAKYLGAGRVNLLKGSWKDGIETLSQSSSLIILTPSANRGTRLEMEMLTAKRLWRKVIVVMPGQMYVPNSVTTMRRYLGESFSGADRRSLRQTLANLPNLPEQWELATEAAKRIGVQLPPYDPEGALFTVGDDGQVRNLETLMLMHKGGRVRRVRELIESLLTGHDG